MFPLTDDLLNISIKGAAQIAYVISGATSQISSKTIVLDDGIEFNVEAAANVLRPFHGSGIYPNLWYRPVFIIFYAVNAYAMIH